MASLYSNKNNQVTMRPLPSNVEIMDMSQCPSGTWKDIRSKLIVQMALKRNINKLAIITAGNAGYSLATMATPHGINVVCVVGNSVSLEIKERLEKAGARVITVDLTKEYLTPDRMVNLCRTNKTERIWDVTNGFSAAFSEALQQMVQTRPVPDYIVCPVGSGEAFLGFRSGIKQLQLKTKLIGVRPMQHPSIADKLSMAWNPYKKEREMAQSEGHRMIKVAEHEILDLYNTYKGVVRAEPSATVVFKMIQEAIDNPDKKYLLVSSGKGQHG